MVTNPHQLIKINDRIKQELNCFFGWWWNSYHCQGIRTRWTRYCLSCGSLWRKESLKWYLNAPDDKFYRNLEHNIASGAPSDAFLWPEYLTEKQQGSYGYIMKLRPQNYYEFGNFLYFKGFFQVVYSYAVSSYENL